jgi:hypothetical protein
VSSAPPQAQATGPATVKISSNLPADAFERLKTLAYNRGTTMTEVLRRAIELEELFEQVKREGGKLLIEDRNGKFRIILR